MMHGSGTGTSLSVLHCAVLFMPRLFLFGARKMLDRTQLGPILTILIAWLRGLDRDRARAIYLLLVEFMAKAAANSENRIDNAIIPVLEGQAEPVLFGRWVDFVLAFGGESVDPIVLEAYTGLPGLVAAGDKVGIGPQVGELIADLEAQAIDPATIAAIIQAILALLEWWRNR